MEDYDKNFAQKVGQELAHIARSKNREIATYDTETVRQLLGLGSLQDVWNLTRPGKPLHEAQVRRGSFNKQLVKRAQAQFIRRELAAQLGRRSPRFLDNSHAVSCPQCPGVAVEWEGSQICENGHTTTPEKQK